MAKQTNPVSLITDNIDIWSSAIQKKKGVGRGSSKKINLYGIKKLRELILELAVRGLLVEQDSNDEPASDLLLKIESEKSKLVADKTIKVIKNLPLVDEDEKPYIEPQGWEWVRLGNISIINPRNDFDDKKESSFIPMPLISTAFDGQHKQEVRIWSEIKKGYTHFADGDIAVAKITPCFENSKAAIFRELKNGVGAGTTELHVARPIAETINSFYILLYLKAPQFLTVGKTKMTGSAGQKRVPRDFFSSNPLPLPPLAEQNRIVTKVNELMTLCDQLEQQQENSITAHKILVETLLAALTNAANKGDFESAWKKIADHFDTLFTTEHSIDQLKQTILQLAVMGKLVPQDPNDEPASELFEKLTTERDGWIKSNLNSNSECKIMARKLEKLNEPSPPFPLPESWCCVHLIQLSQLLVDCHNKTAPYTDSGIPIIRTTNIRHRKFRMEGMKYVNEETYDYWSRRCPPKAGDIMFTREAPMGEAAVIPEGVKWCLGQRTMLIRPMHGYVSENFLLLTLTEPHLLERASEHAIGTTVKHLRVGDVENLNIPLPPIEEQKRIVTRVDELMALCESLKKHINTAKITQLHLADAMAEQAIV